MKLFKSIATFGGFTLISRITGFLRDMVLANYLGAGLVSDAFLVAFKLPNLFRSLFAEGAFTTAFVPMLSHKLIADGKEKSMIFAGQAISVLIFFLIIFVIIAEIFMPSLIALIAPGFINDPEKIALATTLSRITFPFLLLISVVSFQSGILNSLDKFAAPAAAPVILNLMMIASIFIFIPFGETPAHGAAIGVTFAGFIEILWLHFFLTKQNIHLRPSFDIFRLSKNEEIRTLFKRIAPGVLGSGVYQINMLVDTILVSLVGTGAISWLYYANRLQQLPLGVVGAAIGIAVLPILSRHLKSEEFEDAREVQNKAVEYGALLSIPSAIGLIVLAKPIINILFQRGQFGELETLMTSQAVIAYSFGLPAYVMVKALAPNFFARCDTKTPVKYSIIIMITNLILAFSLMQFFGHVGIASATSITAFLSLYQYCRGLKKRGYWNFPPLLFKKIILITLSSMAMGISIIIAQFALNYYYINWLSFSLLIKFPIFLTLCILGVATFTISAKMTGVLDIRAIMKMISIKRKKNA